MRILHNRSPSLYRVLARFSFLSVQIEQTQAQKAGVEDFLAAFEKMPESLTIFSSRRCAVFWSEETVHSYAFVFQKPYLFIDTSGVSGQATVRPHNPVAGNDEGNGIVPNSSSDGLC